MNNKELRMEIINYLCGEDEISPRFLKLLAAGGMGPEDGLAIKDRLLEHLDSITDLDSWFSEYYFYQYRLCHGLVKSIDIRLHEGLKAAEDFIPPSPDGLYSMDDYPYEELKKYRNDEKYLELVYRQFPQTVEEAVESIVSNLSQDSIKYALNHSKSEFISMQHFGLGLFIRNDFGSRSKKGMNLRIDIDKRGGQSFPPDGMSSYLVGEVWEYINSNYEK